MRSCCKISNASGEQHRLMCIGRQTRGALAGCTARDDPATAARSIEVQAQVLTRIYRLIASGTGPQITRPEPNRNVD